MLCIILYILLAYIYNLGAEIIQNEPCSGSSGMILYILPKLQLLVQRPMFEAGLNRNHRGSARQSMAFPYHHFSAKICWCFKWKSLR